jgi:hypothetical protein
MFAKHSLKLMFAKLRWTAKRSTSAITRGELEDYLKEIENEYNEGYRKNPTNHNVLRLEGKVELLKKILHGK